MLYNFLKDGVANFRAYLNLTDTSNLSTIKGLMLKTVITVSGVEPFSFYFVKEGYLYGEAPKMADLIANAKGE